MTIYYNKRLKTPDILENGTYKGYEYYIITLGTHPCSYVLLPEGHRYHGKNYNDIPIDCHFGLTYSRDYLFQNNIISGGEWVIGWDYSHYTDYFSMEDYSIPGYKWTLDELRVEVQSVIDQLVDYDILLKDKGCDRE